jgi:hypothetical protein
VGCFKVGSPSGTYPNNTCGAQAAPEEYAKAFIGGANHWFTCLKTTPGSGTYNDPGCSSIGGTKTWFLHDTSLVATVTGKSGVSKLEGEAGGVKIIIECAEDTLSGELEAGGASKGEVKFKNCKVLKKNTKTQLESCTVKEPIEFKFKDQLVGSPVEDEFKPSSGTLFVELEIGGSPCKIAGKDKVEGTQKCELPSAGTLQEVHEIVCKPTGSSLKFAGNPAEFTSTESVKLHSKEFWAAE